MISTLQVVLIWMIQKISFVVIAVALVSSVHGKDSRTKRIHRLKDSLVSVVPDEDPSIWESYPVKADSVNIQLLDKISGKVFRDKLSVNQTMQFGAITITLKKAFVSSPEDMDEVYAYIEITEKNNIIFSNWLFASSPSINLFTHPVYDVRVEF